MTATAPDPLLEKELDELQDFLLSDCMADGDRLLTGVDGLHGFLTAVLSAPDTILPSEWLPFALGEPEFESQAQAERVLGLIMRLYNEIALTLHNREAFVPLLMQRELESGKTVTIAGDWCYGFIRGMAMRDADWRPANHDADFGELIMPIVALGATDPENPLAQFADSHHEELVDRLPESVVALHAYMRKRAGRPGSSRKSEHLPGRNDPCPCGSGKKYKKCCGASGKLH